jgi:hypothetical protein
MNAVRFAPRAERGYVGVDVARLDHCARQMEAAGLGAAFTPVLIEVAQAIGFIPQAAFFQPYQPLNNQINYAYFLMTKAAPAG